MLLRRLATGGSRLARPHHLFLETTPRAYSARFLSFSTDSNKDGPNGGQGSAASLETDVKVPGEASSFPSAFNEDTVTTDSGDSDEIDTQDRSTSTGSEHYDVLIIGSGPAAQKCAAEVALRGKKVGVVDKRSMLGGVCVNTGTIPSKTFREAVLYLTGYNHRAFYGKSYTPAKVTFRDIMKRVNQVVRNQRDVLKHQLTRADTGGGVHTIWGTAAFEDPHTLLVTPDSGSLASHPARLTADKFLIACGSRPARPPQIPFDGKTVLDSDDILKREADSLGRNIIVVGAGVIGMEYASMFCVIPGIKVTVINASEEFLSFADREVVAALKHEMRQLGCRFLLGEELASVKHVDGGVECTLSSNKVVKGDTLLYTVGRQGNADTLNLEDPSINIPVTKRGALSVDHHYRTCHPHIYAAGDCIGFPALASTSMEQGRLVAGHIVGETGKEGEEGDGLPPNFESFPYGIYTIPEISMIGRTERELTRDNVPYEMGRANYRELAKGQMQGGSSGLLKILFHRDTLKVLGVHAYGQGATEIIHIGQMVMQLGGTVEYFRDAVFNYPTLAEAYRVAALNGLHRM